MKCEFIQTKTRNRCRKTNSEKKNSPMCFYKPSTKKCNTWKKLKPIKKKAFRKNSIKKTLKKID